MLPKDVTYQCPACDAAGSFTHQLAATSVSTCEVCGLVYCAIAPEANSPSAGPSSVQTDEGYTDALISQYGKRRYKYEALASARYREYAALLGCRSFRLLEVGCGVAGLRERFVALGVQYTGIDIDPRVIDAARRFGAEDRQALLSDFLEFDVPDGSFDVVCASQVLEHIRAPRSFVEKAYRVLARGGVLHCDVPNHNGLAGWLSKAMPVTSVRFGGIVYPHHSYAYTEQSLSRLLSGHFQVETRLVTPLHATWGQAVVPSLMQMAYYGASRMVGAPSIVVAIGTAR